MEGKSGLLTCISDRKTVARHLHKRVRGKKKTLYETQFGS